LMRGGMARGGRMDCNRDGENADQAGANARPSAQSRMICCQLCLPNPAIMTGRSYGLTLRPNVNFP